MTKPEEMPNPDRPGSYEEYTSERGKALQAEDLFHYFNNDLFLASHELQSIKQTVDRLNIPAPDKDSLLSLIASIDKRHGGLQTIALDSIKMLADFQKQQ
jgi:hypothetical protein